MGSKTTIAAILSFLSLGFSSGVFAARVDVCGDLPANATWTSGNVYVISCDSARVPPGVTLSIQAGAIVKFWGGNLTVDGTLNVSGSAGSPVHFTSYNDDSVGGDTNGDGGATVPGPGWWNAVTFDAGSSGNISNAIFTYGGGNYWYYDSKAEIRCYSSGVQISGCTFRQSGYSGIYAERVGITVSNCIFGPGNAVRGLTLWGSSATAPISVTGNVFVADSGQAGLFSAEVAGTQPLTLGSNRAQGACAFLLQGTTGGNITVDNGSALPILANLTVSAGTTLSLAPGTIVKSNGNMLDVNGTLLAQGSGGAPIVFTSWWDDTAGGNSDGDAGDRPPLNGDWQAITFGGGSTGRISNAKVSYGGSNYWLYDSKANVRCYSSDVILDGLTLNHSANHDIYVERAGAQIANSTFEADHAGYALRVEGAPPSSPLTVTGNTFKGASGGLGRIVGGGAAGKAIVFQNNRADCPCGFSLEGTTSGDVTWENGDQLQLIVGVTVGAGTTLSLGPGTIVKANGADLAVQGTLLAAGTAAQPVTFTSWWDDAVGGDTNGDAGASPPLPGHWNGITFGEGSHGRLANATVAYGGGNYWYYDSKAGIRCYTNDVELQNVKLLNNNNRGMHANGGPRVRVSSITDNSYYGIFNQSNRYWVDARGNWWGDASGPYHPVKNPGGKGQSVSDYVLFFPWADNPSGTVSVKAHVYVEGPSWAAPGDTVDYAITYETGPDTLEGSVLVVSIPLTGNPLECGAGTYLQETSEVFWELGEIQPYSHETLTLTVTYGWGTPLHFEDGLGALLLAQNLDTGSYTFDRQRYLDYVPVTAGAATPMTSGQLQAELAAYPDFKTLYDQALARGFTPLGASIQTVDSVPYTQVTLASYPLGAVAQLLRSRDDNHSILRTYAALGATTEDASGGLVLDYELDSALFTGAWGAARESSSPEALDPKVAAFRNCLLQKGGSYLLGKISQAFKYISGGYKCAKGLLTGDPVGLADCGGLIDKVKETIPIYGEIKMVHTCYWETIIGGQVSKYLCHGPLVKVEPPTVQLFNPETWTEAGRRRMYVMYDCDPLIGVWGKVHSLACPRGYVAQEGADDGEGHPCVPANDLIAFAYGESDKKVPSHTCNTMVRTAWDPNAKSGPAGDVMVSDVLPYTVECENVGEGTAYGVYITDTLSEVFDDSTLSLEANGSYSPGARMIFWDMGDLAPSGQEGSKKEVHFTVKLKPGTPAGTVVTNQATVFFPSVPQQTPTNSVVNTVAGLIATPQTLTVTAGASLPITLSGRGSQRAPLTFAVTQPPVAGNLTGTPPNLTYAPAAGFTGVDPFLFTAADSTGTSRPAQVSITVDPDPNDHTPPTVARTVPAPGQILGVSPSPSLSDTTGPIYLPSIQISFAEAMDATSITAASVELRDPSGALVDRTVAYDAQNLEARITVRAPWQFGAYSATVTTGARDLKGNAMAAPYFWTFTTTNGTGQSAPGDCDGSGTISIGEVQKAINMFLGTLAPACSVDCSGDGTVSIGEVQKVINGFLGVQSSC